MKNRRSLVFGVLFFVTLAAGSLGYFWASKKTTRGEVEKITAQAELILDFKDPWELNEGNASELQFVDLDSPKDSIERRAVKSEFKEGSRLAMTGLQIGHRYRMNAVFYLCKHTNKGLCTRLPVGTLLEVVESGSPSFKITLTPKESGT